MKGVTVSHMPVVFERVLFPAGGSLRVNVPGPFLKALDLKAGDKVSISLNDHQMILEKAKKTKG
jgi:antitoxin component of MazEF toxin-antitoxin module